MASYYKAGDRNLDTLARYCWNTALCEALYPALHGVEIALRNALDRNLTKLTGTPLWFDDQRSFPFLGYHIDRVEKARVALRNDAKPETPGGIVAELPFGYWTSLLGNRFYQSILIPLLATTFPGFKRKKSKKDPCDTLRGTFEDIRYLRNRVFHHEPVWNRTYLFGDYRAILKAIDWVSPEKGLLVKALDRFSTIYDGTHVPYLTSLQEFLRGT
jgi:hypothetical protein